MALPPNAKAMTRPMDPADIVDFQVVLSQGSDDNSFLTPTESVQTYAVALTAEAVAAGLQIVTTGGYATTLVGNTITFWLSVSSGQQSSANFAGSGLTLGIELTITTNSVPARTKQRTVTVNVAQQ